MESMVAGDVPVATALNARMIVSASGAAARLIC